MWAKQLLLIAFSILSIIDSSNPQDKLTNPDASASAPRPTRKPRTVEEYIPEEETETIETVSGGSGAAAAGPRLSSGGKSKIRTTRVTAAEISDKSAISHIAPSTRVAGGASAGVGSADVSTAESQVVTVRSKVTPSAVRGKK
jgi:hypothetical protein